MSQHKQTFILSVELAACILQVLFICALRPLISIKMILHIKRAPPNIWEWQDPEELRADVCIDACTFFYCCGRSRQTLILNSPCRRLRIDRLFVSPRSSAKYKPGKCIQFSTEKTTLCSEKKKKHTNHDSILFLLWFRTLIEFFNNAHQKQWEEFAPTRL